MVKSLLRNEWLLRCVVEWKEVSSRHMCDRVKIERASWVFISAYGPGSESSEEEIEEFWSELSECVRSFGRNESVVVLWDLNARVGNEVIDWIVGQHGVQGRNESANDYWRCVHSRSHWWVTVGLRIRINTLLRMAEGRVVDRALVDYVLLPKRMHGSLLM